jgi:hypothetical protein
MAKAFGIEQREFAKVLLRRTNPWAFLMVFGPELPPRERQSIRAVLGDVPDRYSAGNTKRAA